MNNIKISNTFDDPYALFSEWYRERESSAPENYNAVALSTSSKNCRPSSRMVLLKEYNHEGFVFFTNYNSRKGMQISVNPYASLLFYWPGPGRQIRIEGSVEKISNEESDNYFRSRIHDHKLNALASPQSSEIPGHRYLIDRYEELISKYPEPVPESHHGSKPDSQKESKPARPHYWGGYRLKPLLFEFWQEGDKRLHDRTEYTLHGSTWHIRKLAP
ncbi:MAG: pyridoxamine 5'-phosphate oxidase [Bacteroidales bacterium]